MGEVLFLNFEPLDGSIALLQLGVLLVLKPLDRGIELLQLGVLVAECLLHRGDQFAEFSLVELIDVDGRRHDTYCAID